MKKEREIQKPELHALYPKSQFSSRRLYMPGIKTNDLLGRIGKGDFLALRLNGLQDGSFCMMLDCVDGTFIHENLDGSIKEYNRVDDALSWLKRKTALKEIVVNFEIWKNDLLTR
jgi:hypothetical protein